MSFKKFIAYAWEKSGIKKLEGWQYVSPFQKAFERHVRKKNDLSALKAYKGKAKE